MIAARLRLRLPSASRLCRVRVADEARCHAAAITPPMSVKAAFAGQHRTQAAQPPLPEFQILMSERPVRDLRVAAEGDDLPSHTLSTWPPRSCSNPSRPGSWRRPTPSPDLPEASREHKVLFPNIESSRATDPGRSLEAFPILTALWQSVRPWRGRLEDLTRQVMGIPREIVDGDEPHESVIAVHHHQSPDMLRLHQACRLGAVLVFEA